MSTTAVTLITPFDAANTERVADHLATVDGAVSAVSVGHALRLTTAQVERCIVSPANIGRFTRSFTFGHMQIGLAS